MATARAALVGGRHLLLEGPVGSGKTTLALAVCRELGRATVRVDGDDRFTESRLAGWFDPPLVLRLGYHEEAFVSGPLLRAMREGQVLFLNRGLGLGSLLLGVHRDGVLTYVGRVGTGWDMRTGRKVLDALRPLQVARSPFGSPAGSGQARRALGPAGAGGRGAVPDLDRRRHAAARQLPGPARGSGSGAIRRRAAGSVAAATSRPHRAGPAAQAARRSHQQRGPPGARPAQADQGRRRALLRRHGRSA